MFGNISDGRKDGDRRICEAIIVDNVWNSMNVTDPYDSSLKLCVSSDKIVLHKYIVYIQSFITYPVCREYLL